MADDYDDVDLEGARRAYRRALGWVVALNLGYGQPRRSAACSPAPRR